MAKPSARIGFIQLVLAGAIIDVVARSAQLQIVQGEQWRAEAVKVRTRHRALPARRGMISDRAGLPLAETREFYQVGIAPNEVDDPRAMARVVNRSLDGLNYTATSLEQRLRQDRYFSQSGPFTATEVAPLRGLKGVYLTPIHERTYPAPALARGAIGDMVGDHGVSGLEQDLDSLLAGVAGETVYLRDPRGRQLESPDRLIRNPVPGNDVYLTIDGTLQEIAERALDHALEQMHARSGDVVFLDVRNGEVLAVASRLANALPGTSALLTPFEPGSTAKLFTAAALLMHDRVDSTDTVDPAGGRWTMTLPGKRVTTREIRDAHVEHTPLTLAKTIEVSSNIGIIKFAGRLSLTEQFDMLRDFGFGSRTGVEVFNESRGRLDLPTGLRNEDIRSSRAMGYEISVTPIQLAAAYAAIANGGVLFAPTLVREVRAPDGRVIYRHRPEPVRRVITPAVAARLRDYLRAAVGEGGTGEQAQLQSYKLVGKTGTSHETENGRYVDRYTGSFAAIFPAADPQFVAIVKIDAPTGVSYYGAQTAAPLLKEMLLEALASPQSVVSRDLRAAPAGDERSAERLEPVRPAASVPVVAVSWPYHSVDTTVAAGPVPDVSGTSVRAAAATLQRRGYRVSLHGFGQVTRTVPAAGETVRPGTTVAVWTDR